MMYIHDFDERYPFCLDNDANGDVVTWPTLISSYVKNTQIFYCPSSSRRTASTQYGQYGANRLVMLDGEGDKTLASASIISSTGTYMVMDAGHERMHPQLAYAPDATKRAYIPGTGPGSPSNLTPLGTWPAADMMLKRDFEIGRHLGGVNMIFADGHVKFLQSQTVVRQALSTPSAWNPAHAN